MKKMNKIFALLLAMVMVLSMSVSVFADGTDGTITVNNAAISKEYKAYKILDATIDGDAIAYTTKEEMKAVIGAEDSPFTVAAEADANGNYAVESDADAATISAWIEANLSSFTAISATEGVDENDIATASTVKWTGLAYGYYYVTSSLGTEVTIDSVNPSVTIIDKNTTGPSGEEEVKKDDQDTAQIGDVVNFTVRFTATNWYTPAGAAVESDVEKVTEYTVTDTPNGYDIDVNSLEVTVGEQTITDTIVDEAVDATTGVLTFTIPWVDEDGNHIYASPVDVVIKYSGTVNEDAFVGQATNDVSIGNDANEDKITGNAGTVNHNLTINKTDGTSPLEGAQFELYRNDETTAMNLIALTADEIAELGIEADENTVYYRVAYDGENGTTTIDMSEATSAIIYGLDGEDTYKIKEIKAPAGYNKLQDTVDHPMENNDGAETIENKKGTELPSTGGMGTTILYVVGGILVVAAVVLLFVKRRVEEN